MLSNLPQSPAGDNWAKLQEPILRFSVVDDDTSAAERFVELRDRFELDRIPARIDGRGHIISPVVGEENAVGSNTGERRGSRIKLRVRLHGLELVTHSVDRKNRG